jgi:hypothetical protein
MFNSPQETHLWFSQIDYLFLNPPTFDQSILEEFKFRDTASLGRLQVLDLAASLGSKLVSHIATFLTERSTFLNFSQFADFWRQTFEIPFLRSQLSRTFKNNHPASFPEVLRLLIREISCDQILVQSNFPESDPIS